jgi:hypothetical protein
MVDESDSLAALSKQQGSTLTSEIRKAAMGEELGSGNVGDTRTHLQEESYRFVVLMCMQPELAGWLMGGESGGLPQRFLWCAVRDPRVVEGIEHPGQFKIKLPFESTPENPFEPSPRRRYVMQGSPRIWTEIRETTKQNKQSGDDEVTMDGHAMLTRRKVSAALAFMDGRIEDNDEDWDLAGQVIEMSDASREWVQSRLAVAAAKDAENRAKARGRAQHIQNQTIVSMESKADEEIEAAILEYLNGYPGHSVGELRRNKFRSLKGRLEALVDGLIADGAIRTEEQGRKVALFVVGEA